MIPVRNIYYMLSYAFQSLKKQGVRESDVESFDSALELYAEILIKGVGIQIKSGLVREYKPKTEVLSSLKGKIEVSESIRTQSIIRRQLICTYDEYSPDTQLNRLIKTTFMMLLRSDIASSRKKAIKRLIPYFAEVDELDVYNIDWNIRFNRNNQSYELLKEICHLIISGLLQMTSDGTVRTADFTDEQSMSRLYEKFILNYYRQHYPTLSPSSAYIPWQIDSGFDGMLPAMKSDIMLQKDNRILIIDAKYYSRTTQIQFDKHTIHSANLYQIFAYVKNKEYELKDVPHTVSGMLLYAKTDQEIQPDSTYVMSGNKISVKTLNLNQDFLLIAYELNCAVDNCFA